MEFKLGDTVFIRVKSDANIIMTNIGVIMGRRSDLTFPYSVKLLMDVNGWQKKEFYAFAEEELTLANKKQTKIIELLYE